MTNRTLRHQLRLFPGFVRKFETGGLDMREIGVASNTCYSIQNFICNLKSMTAPLASGSGRLIPRVSFKPKQACDSDYWKTYDVIFKSKQIFVAKRVYGTKR